MRHVDDFMMDEKGKCLVYIHINLMICINPKFAKEVVSDKIITVLKVLF